MLENASLLLRTLQPPQVPRPDGSVPEIAVLDLASEATLGSVHRGGSPWPRWLAPSSYEIFETDDLSHVCSLQRRWPWSPEWAVHDAEGRTVGTILMPPARWGLRLFLSDVRRPNFDRVCDTRIDDATGSCIARLQGNGTSSRFRSLAGVELACLSRNGADRELTFFAADNPFTRMLLLAAAVLSD